MSLSLQLTAFAIGDTVSWSDLHGDLTSTIFESNRSVLVSPRTFKAISGPRSKANSIRVKISNINGNKSVVASLKTLDSDVLRGSIGMSTPFILAPPNILTSVGVVLREDKVLVSMLVEEPREVAQIALAEISGSAEHSPKVHELIIGRYMKSVSEILTVDEVMGLPIWSGGDLFEYNDISDRNAPVGSWIGPGRLIDSREDIIVYKVVSLTAANNDSIYSGIISTETKVVMVAPRRKESSAIPSMKRFLFPTTSRADCPEVTGWLRRISPKPTRAGLVVSPETYSRLTMLENSAERVGFFTEVVNCRTIRSSQDLVTRLERIRNPKASVVILDYFEDIFDDIFDKIPANLLERFIIISVCESYEDAIKKVSSPFFFSDVFEMPLSNDDSSLEDAYKLVLSAVGFDQDKCISEMRKRGNKDEESDKAINVLWEDIGGLEGAKQELRDLMSSGLRRGVLLYGPPGTGKTLLAKAIATQASTGSGKRMGFIGVKGPELLSMYIGESEKNVRNVFQRARNDAPCVIFFDEIDSLAPARGRASDSANVMDRVVSSLLTELDNLPPDVIVVAATNRPDLLDSSLVRPGRIDRQVYIGIPEDKSELVRALCRKFGIRDPDYLFEEIRGIIPRSMTGSDLAGVFRKAYLACAKRMMGDAEFEISLTPADVISALHSTTPSVSESERVMYEELRDRRATVIG